jgi:hypothetical protein
LLNVSVQLANKRRLKKFQDIVLQKKGKLCTSYFGFNFDVVARKYLSKESASN